MMIDKEDLGLSLSPSFPHNHHSLRLNLMPSFVPTSAAASSPLINSQEPSWHETFTSSADPNSVACRVETRSFLRVIDVNRLPATDDLDQDEAGISSPKSTLSSVSGKRSGREGNGEDNEKERASSRGVSDEEDGDTSRKKLRLSKDKSAVLEEKFKDHSTLNPKQKMALARQLGLRPRQVEVWFQNRRARTKFKQTEVDCEFLKRCYENLTEENRRLQKEVQELRALKLSPQFYMPMTPPTTLTMCPSCERVSAQSSGSSSAHDHHPRPHCQLGPTHHRPIPIYPWASVAAPPISHGPIEAIRPRS